jgi:hypothetical protein
MLINPLAALALGERRRKNEGIRYKTGEEYVEDLNAGRLDNYGRHLVLILPHGNQFSLSSECDLNVISSRKDFEESFKRTALLSKTGPIFLRVDLEGRTGSEFLSYLKELSLAVTLLAKIDRRICIIARLHNGVRRSLKLAFESGWVQAYVETYYQPQILVPDINPELKWKDLLRERDPVDFIQGVEESAISMLNISNVHSVNLSQLTKLLQDPELHAFLMEEVTSFPSI